MIRSTRIPRAVFCYAFRIIMEALRNSLFDINICILKLIDVFLDLESY